MPSVPIKLETMHGCGKVRDVLATCVKRESDAWHFFKNSFSRLSKVEQECLSGRTQDEWIQAATTATK